MSAGHYNIPDIEQGVDFELNITWKDQSGNLVDLTGYKAQMQLRGDFSDAKPLVSLTTENGLIVLGGVAGTIQVIFTAALLANVTVTSAVYALVLIAPDNKKVRLLDGKAKISLSAVR